MRIGIDIDDTTVIAVNSMIKYADIYDINILGRKGTNGNLGLIQNRYYLKALYGWTDEEKFDFFNRYYKSVLEECEAMPYASEVIKKLKEEGNEIFFITARLNNIKNCDSEAITRKTLEENNIPYDKLIVNASDKLKFCKEHNIEIFIEDSYDTCKQLQESGIKSYLMTTRMNEKINSLEVDRVTNWNEIYSKIHNFIKKKSNK